MMTTALNDTATGRELFFGGMPVDPTDALAQSLHQHGSVKSLLSGCLGLAPIAEREVASQADSLLSMDLFDLIAEGWKKYTALVEAARRTRAAPATKETVDLATHRIEYGHHPAVEVFIDGKSAGTLKIDLTVAFTMAAIVAVVSAGRLMEIQTGNCTVSGTLAMKGIVVAERQRKFDLPGAVRLRRGVALLEPSPAAAPGEHVVVSQAPSSSARPDWYPDPTRRYQLRRWDGSRWTDQVI
jgi:Protein of unknown function (DUF2510)